MRGRSMHLPILVPARLALTCTLGLAFATAIIAPVHA
jgi:hypothetical protein